jgi:guanylate kinase
MVSHDKFLEWANVYGKRYGVPREPVEEALARGEDTIVKVDIQGAATIKRILPQAISIFLVPPSMEELSTRLQERHTESAFDLSLRSGTAAEEIKQAALFDYLVVNHQDKIDLAVEHIKAIITAEKCRIVHPKTSTEAH